MALARHVYVYALGLWTGAAIFFAAVLAPGAFRVIQRPGVPDPRSIAGELVTYAVGRLHLAGIVAGVAAVACMLWAARDGAVWRNALRAVPGAVVLLGSAAGMAVSWRMRALRAGMGMPIDQVPAADPARVTFNALHHSSTTLMGLAVVAGLVALALRPREAT